MKPEHEQIVFTAQAGERLDKQIVAQVGDRLTRTQIQALIRDGLATVDGQQVKAGIRLKGGEQIVLTIPPAPVDTTVAAEPIPLSVVYEDRDIAAIDKPAGLVVHPGAGNETGTLVNALLARYPQIAEIRTAPKRRGIVHRLDKDTSGLILVALREPALHRLMTQFQRRTVEKRYLALLERTPKTMTGLIDVPIGRDPVQRRKMSPQRDGREAISEFNVIETFASGHALVEVKPQTGRTHQIRVHMAFIGCPLVGDLMYGHRKQRLLPGRHFLHAARLCIDHPRTGERLCFESPLPERLAVLLDELRSGRVR